ncbi:hypothetical protein [Mycetocola zhadangensis]|uniref:HEAT repeat domain-containing protein n=1 Tax=Mycetocola zhadangensis TaxID=1164595 RepID=A0A3L7ITE1_9MICO|nr:hypothetical protein [Mycetocola zhadangensis]RLQ81439.1 hypothetical protein D9V28_13885 [Mycetocola zhadangensis]GGF01628.1 hypothetical protein GCM10011313_25980 [Mycetocola zhadangensis]
MSNDTPQLGRDQDAIGDELSIRERRTFPDVSGDESLYRRLNDTISVMTASGRDADETYHATLHSNQGDDEFANLVFKTLDALDETAYVERWALVQLAIDLENPLAGDYLAELVRRPIPAEQAEDPGHGISTVTEEVILRTTAIEGLARLLRHDVDTTELLLETIASADFVAMRRAAWFALAESGRDDVIERARAILTDRDEIWIANLRRTPVREAEQHDPRLIDPPRGGLPAPFDE